MLEKLPETFMYWAGWVSWVLKEETCNQPTGVRFREVGTRIRLPKLLDRVATGRVQAGFLDTPNA